MHKDAVVICGKHVDVRARGRSLASVPGTRFVKAAQAARETGWLSERLPPQVQWVERRGPGVVVAAELPPVPRTIRQPAAESPERFGPSAVHRERRLSFPSIVVPMLFYGPELELADARLFYRNRLLRGRPEDAQIFVWCVLDGNDVPATTSSRPW